MLVLYLYGFAIAIVLFETKAGFRHMQMWIY